MHSCIFDHRSTRRLDDLNYLIFLSPARPFLGLSSRWILLPYSLYPPSGAYGICPLGFFCFTRHIQNTLDFSQRLEYSDLFLGFLFSMFNVKLFSGGRSKVSRNVFYCPFRSSCWSILFRLIHISSRKSPILYPDWYFPPLLSGGFLWGLDCPKR